jgi:NADH dehydrogenase/NADH:ubiquinone oxidoreductase subunit G
MLLTIDLKQVRARQGQTLLEVARGAGIDIPTLCHHEALEPRGACRLCMVKISNPKWPGWSRLVASCVYPAEDGLIVQTATDEVEEVRKVIVDLLLARCPETEEIAALGRRYGLEKSTFAERQEEDDHCILCGICVRVCQDVIGVSAIGVSGRGATKVVGPPFGRVAEDCIGCGACAHACPTGAIALHEAGGMRRIWGRDFELDRCVECGRSTLPDEQVRHLVATTGLSRPTFEMCDECRRRKTADKFETVMGR